MSHRPNRKIAIFESALESVGRVLSDKYHIKVVFTASNPSTDGKHIYLPPVPADADKDLLRAMHGYLDHEASHCVNSDFDVIAAAHASPRKMFVLNHLEDVRIEHRWCRLYPGARSNLEAAYEWHLKQTAQKWSKMSIFGQVIFAAHVYVDAADRQADHWFIRDVVSPDVMAVVKAQTLDIFERVRTSETTADAAALADELLRRLDKLDAQPPAPPIPSPEENKSEESSEGEEESAAGAQSTPSEDHEETDPEEESQDPEEEDPEEEGEEGTADPAQDEPEEDPGEQPSGGGGSPSAPAPAEEQTSPPQTPAPAKRFDPSPQEVASDTTATSLATQLHEVVKAQTPADQYLVYTTEGDRVAPIEPGNAVAFRRFVAKTSRVAAPLRRQLVRALSTRSESRWEGGKERGTINARDLYKLATDTGNDVFRTQVVGDLVDCAIMLAVDHSDSMRHDGKINLAAELAAVLGQTFEPLNIAFSVYGWSTDLSHVAQSRFDRAKPEDRARYSRWGNLWLGEYKSFTESWRKAGPKVLTMPENTRANTYDGETVRLLAQRLLRRPEKRKILMICNDGMPFPNSRDNHVRHIQHAQDCARAVEAQVETLVFGIKTTAVEQFYSNTVIVNDLNDLPKTALRQMQQLLVGGRMLKSSRKKSAAV